MLFEPMLKNPQCISVFMKSGIGDSVVYIPALHVLRAMYPDAKISFMCNLASFFFYKQFHLADRYYILDGDFNEDEFVKELNGENRNFLSASDLIEQGPAAKPFVHEQQQDHWGATDLLIMTERNRHYIKLSLTSKCKQVLTYSYTRALYTSRLPFIRPFSRRAQHEIFGFQFLLKTLDKKRYLKAFNELDLQKSILKASPEARQFIQDYLTKLGYLTKEADPITGLVPKHRAQQDNHQTHEHSAHDDAINSHGDDMKRTAQRVYKDMIIINPLCISTFKKGYSYHPDDYVKLALQLAKDFPHILFIISSYGQQSFHDIEIPYDNLKLLINKGDMSNVIALIEQCDLIVSPSTGPAHIADNIGRDVIGSFPFYDEYRWRADGFMQLAAKQKVPTLEPHDLKMQIVNHKVANDEHNKFDEFCLMCHDYIAAHFPKEL